MNNIWIYQGASEAWTSRRSLEHGCLYFPFEDLELDLSALGNQTLIQSALLDKSSELARNENAILSIDLLANGMQKGDWIIIPGKFNQLYHMGEITGDYVYLPDEDYGLHHSRSIDWFLKDVPVTSLPIRHSETVYQSQSEPVLLNEKESSYFRQSYQMAAGF
ncbi:MAG: hypothetical protein GC180_01965 [Bacteroidetes bacterium]|nr:hypothetical protein [Bacteroidota bacterium]